MCTDVYITGSIMPVFCIARHLPTDVTVACQPVSAAPQSAGLVQTSDTTEHVNFQHTLAHVIKSLACLRNIACQYLLSFDYPLSPSQRSTSPGSSRSWYQHRPVCRMRGEDQLLALPACVRVVLILWDANDALPRLDLQIVIACFTVSHGQARLMHHCSKH